jgi:hypothetical protein
MEAARSLRILSGGLNDLMHADTKKYNDAQAGLERLK